MKSEKIATDQEVLKVFEPPFRYDENTQMIVDNKERQVIQIRGWSALLKITDGQTASAIQDKFGVMVVGAINEKYYRPKPNTPFKSSKK